MLTAESILFGGDVNAPVRSRLARAIGKSEPTLCRWSKDAGKIPLESLRALVRIRGLTDQQIVQIVRGR